MEIKWCVVTKEAGSMSWKIAGGDKQLMFRDEDEAEEYVKDELEHGMTFKVIPDSIMQEMMDNGEIDNR